MNRSPRFIFGKFKGKLFKTIIKENYKYCAWVRDNIHDQETRKVMDILMNNYLQYNRNYKKIPFKNIIY